MPRTIWSRFFIGMALITSVASMRSQLGHLGPAIQARSASQVGGASPFWNLPRALLRGFSFPLLGVKTHQRAPQGLIRGRADRLPYRTGA